MKERLYTPVTQRHQWVVGDVMKDPKRNTDQMQEVIFASGELVITKSLYYPNLAPITRSAHTIENDGYELYIAANSLEPVKVKVTLEEIAKWKGVDVSQIVIEEEEE